MYRVGPSCSALTIARGGSRGNPRVLQQFMHRSVHISFPGHPFSVALVLGLSTISTEPTRQTMAMAAHRSSPRVVGEAEYEIFRWATISEIVLGSGSQYPRLRDVTYHGLVVLIRCPNRVSLLHLPSVSQEIHRENSPRASQHQTIAMAKNNRPMVCMASWLQVTKSMVTTIGTSYIAPI